MATDKNSNNSYSTLQVKIIQAVDLKIQDDETYVYATVEYGEVTKQTARIAHTANPTWLQTLSFVLTTVRKIKINVFYMGHGRERRIGKISQSFNTTKNEEISYTQKLTKGKLIYSVQVVPEALPITSQPVIPPNPDHFDDSSSEDEQDPNPNPAKVFNAREPANPAGILDSLVKALTPTVRRTPNTGGGARGAIGNAIGDAIGQACLYMFCYFIIIAIIIVAVIITLVTRFT